MRAWKGPENFRAVLARHGFSHRKSGLERVISLMEADKPPTVGSIRQACLRKGCVGFKKQATVEALCAAIGCSESDLYEGSSQAPASTHRSTWDRLRDGVDVEDRLKWPL